MNTSAIIKEGRFSDRNILDFNSRHPTGLDSETDIRRKCDLSL